MTTTQHEHFKGKEAIDHVAEVQAEGFIAAAEVHGLEPPGYMSAGADAARDTAFVLTLAMGALSPLTTDLASLGIVLGILSLGWIVWKTGRSAWLGWFRLERLHRIVDQERWEIEHHRPQEREELKALYSAKGFEGKLLEDVLDVLMADNDRLLRIMVEEELGLTLASHDHPLKQALGAFVGCFATAFICLAGFFLLPPYGLLIASILCVGFASAVSAAQAGNRWVDAIIWNVGLLAFAFGTVHFLMEYVLS